MESAGAALTSTTAPGKVFESRAELAEHYKTQWHKYNLKRREAGLPPLLEADFEARLAAAQEAIQQQQQQQQQSKGGGTNNSHLKANKKQQRDNKKHSPPSETTTGGATLASQTPGYDRVKQQQQQQQQQESSEEKEPELAEEETVAVAAPRSEDAVMSNVSNPVEINPRQCLFDRHISCSVEENVARMQRKYGFFVPDQEYLTDLEGLIGYCHEKIQVGRLCLYCLAGFKSGRACQQHMMSSQHTKLRYEVGQDLEEYAVFYDFTQADQEFFGATTLAHRAGSGTALMAAATTTATKKLQTLEKKDRGTEEEDWEDVSDDEEGAEDEDDDDDEMEDVYAGYEREVAAMGLDVTPLGELIFPDGRIIGHRAFRRYYKQRVPARDTRTAVVAARHAAGDRLYQGRVVNVHDAALVVGGGSLPCPPSQRSMTSLGRSGKGILVPANGSNGASSFTQLSMYRYRAAVRKQRKGEAMGNRIKERTTLPMNRMDKKANRLMNGVSVAHAKR